FQALRIAVNDELAAFNGALHQAANVVGINGRIAVITLHSLEDRSCKQAFKRWSKAKERPRSLPIIQEGHEAPFRLLRRNTIGRSDNELDAKRRSRSAKLRILEKVRTWDKSFTYVEGWKK